MASTIYKKIVSFIRGIYQTDEFIPLHEPRFWGNEKKYLNDCIDSTFVSSVGEYVDRFEKEIAEFTGAKYAVAVVNGTQALFVGLKMVGARPETEVITQSLTFIATANAIHYTGAKPIFLDVDIDTLGLSPKALRHFLEKHCVVKDGCYINQRTRKQIIACVPMHTLGHPCRIGEIKDICKEYCLKLVEDSAESIGSYVDEKHTGLFGDVGILSFNGNKTITTGGGGMIITDHQEYAEKAKHLTTTAKQNHPWQFNHDEIGYNYRMPNINAALGVAQLEELPIYLQAKKQLANQYKQYFSGNEIKFVNEPKGTSSNFWLNAILLKDVSERDDFLDYSNKKGVMTRCLWTPMHRLEMYSRHQRDDLKNTDYLFDRIVNLPSSVPKN